jgi:hypothetical protein
MEIVSAPSQILFLEFDEQQMELQKLLWTCKQYSVHNVLLLNRTLNSAIYQWNVKLSKSHLADTK